MSYPLATLACSISATGISCPTYADILASLQASFQIIYGADAYLQPDSQDGQLLAIFAQAIHDANQATIAAYNSFSPQTAVGVGLSSVVKINNMTRALASYSQVNVTLTGVAGTTIANGQVGDTSGNVWVLPTPVVIPPAGSIIVTASAQQLGSVAAPIGSITKILTPTAGWQSVYNASAASPGNPVESDAELRSRQEITPALNSNTIYEALLAALRALPGVTYVTIYENDTATTDANGVPPYSIACVVQGGVAADIAQTIYNKKAMGVSTYGTTTVSISDVVGNARNINFFVPTPVPIKVAISLHALTGYTTAIAAEIQASVAAYINGLQVGDDVLITRLYAPALLNGARDSSTYEITVLQAALSPSGTLGTADIPIAFTSQATCLASDVTITVV